MMTLNLPPADLRLSQREGNTMVFDFLRRRYVKLTPEEWVRQHFVHFLVHHKGYPQELLANEVSLTLNSTSKRCDTVLYSTNASPLAIVEYKAPNIQLTQKVFDQITRYNIVLRVPYLMVSNGLQHYCCRVDYETNVCTFLPEIPNYEAIKN
jgi:hypothetical protein